MSETDRGLDSVAPLAPEKLRWIVDAAQLGFDSTDEIEPLPDVIGQPLALEALQFGLDCDAPGQNVFVRGIRGTGRLTMVQRVLAQMRPTCASKVDRCYVHNFLQPDRPRLVSLPYGRARVLRRRLRELSEFVASDLGEALNSEHLQASRSAIQEEAQGRIRELTDPLETELEEAGLALVQIKTPHGMQAAIFPRIQGQPVPMEQFEALVRQGQIPQERRDEIYQRIEEFAKRLPEMTQRIGRVFQDSSREIERFNEDHIRRLVGDLTRRIAAEFSNHALDTYLEEVVDDVLEHALQGPNSGYDPQSRYGINILLEHRDDDSPVVIENSPSLTNLLGTVETQWEAGGQATSDYRAIRAGSLLQADGGFLILDAHDVLAEPGAWKILMRTLRNGVLEIVPREFSSPFAPVSLKPEPIPVNIRVILMGSASLYYQLDMLDYDFSGQFKVLADFNDVLGRGETVVRDYAGVLSRIVREEGMRHLTPCGVAALAEHGARIADKGGRVTAQFGRIADITREADWVAGKAGASLISGDHVREAVRRTKTRASLPSSRFQSFLKDGTVGIQTQGSCVGQINGLAVIAAGPLKYGFPARITASIGAGSAGVINVEGLASMSGAIHTKGFHILGGLLRHLLKTDHPLAFSASIAFEQSYGGIDGDSASGAEMCCLLSALTGVPLRQDLAITGAIDQHGAIQAIGGVNEKIEGFFDICQHFELTGTQGVIIPESNAADLMLRHDVVEAAREGRFAVYPVANVRQALALLTGLDIGQWGDQGYPESSLLGLARRRAREFWEETVRGPMVASPSDSDSSAQPEEASSEQPQGQKDE